MKIEQSDISVIVQGIVENNTKECLLSIRKTLPKSEIIFSTQEGQNTDSLQGLYDKLIISKDCGSSKIFIHHPDKEQEKRCFNLNRQMNSSRNGLMASSNKYAIKIRSDMIMHSSNFLKYFGRFKKFQEEYRAVKERIIVFQSPTPRKENNYGVAFFIRDYFYFGEREDLLLLFGQEDMSKGDLNYFRDNHQDAYKTFHWPKGDKPTSMAFRYGAEQYITLGLLNCIDKKIKFDHIYCSGINTKEDSVGVILNNFTLLDRNKMGVSAPKQDKLFYFCDVGAWRDMKFIEWKALYEILINKNVIFGCLLLIISNFQFIKKLSLIHAKVISRIKNKLKCVLKTLIGKAR